METHPDTDVHHIQPRWAMLPSHLGLLGIPTKRLVLHSWRQPQSLFLEVGGSSSGSFFQETACSLRKLAGERVVSLDTSAEGKRRNGLSSKDNTAAPDLLRVSLQNLPNELSVGGGGYFPHYLGLSLGFFLNLHFSMP